VVSTIELLLLVLIPLLVVLPTIALINLLRHQFTGNDKLIWLLVILLLPVVGPVLYFAKGGKNKISEEDC
jgi:hypothetical protein